ncbi:MAG: DNA-binding response regulator [Caldilinea sp. CFX5]|nr:DNA-binding response regulator [Caldilinea sp. CFX5]
MKILRLLLIDDQAAVREGLRLRLSLEPDLRVVGEASDGAEALALAVALQPDIALVDVNMLGPAHAPNGIALTTALRQVAPPCAVIILSLYDDAATRQRAQAAGAAAFVAKQAGIVVLLAAIRNIGRKA